MLYILFSLGNDRYALDSRHVAEVVPRVECLPLLKVPPYVSPGCCAIGVSSYRC
jgi:chemotaxis signal transduction protein